jgi:hypothetical protein
MYMMKKLHLVFFFFFCLVRFSYADYHFSSGDVEITSNLCNGGIKFKLKILDKGGIDDYVRHLYFQYKDMNGTYRTFAEFWGKDDNACNYETNTYKYFPDGDCDHYGFTVYGVNTNVVGDVDWESAGDLHWGTFTWLSVPDGDNFSYPFNGAAGDNIKVCGDFGHDHPDWRAPTSDFDTVDFTKSATVFSISTPTALMATTDNCDKIVLSWQEPTGSCDPAKKYRIYRDDTYVVTTDWDQTSYDYIPSSRGIDYSFTIMAVWADGAGRERWSDLSTAATGKRKDVLLPPDNITASNDLCDGIAVEWEWNLTESATNFRINANGYTSPNISGTLREYKLQMDKYGFQPGNTYNLQIQSENSCGWGPLSSNVVGALAIEPIAPDNLTVLVDTADNYIRLSWRDNSDNESGFKIERTLSGGGGSAIYEVNSNKTSFEDHEAENCSYYLYKVKAYNQCNIDGVASDTTVKARLVPDLSCTFDNDNKLKASKGYYTNKITLEWSSNNTGLIKEFQIYRRILGSIDSPTFIGTSSSGLYTDNTADAGILYEYIVIGVSDCGNDELQSNSTSDVGFRSPTGFINGQVTYTGGISVKNAKILLARTSGQIGSSVYLDGVDDYIVVDNSNSLNPKTGMTIEAWVRPEDLSSNHYIFEKGNAYKLYIKDKKPEFSVNNASVILTSNDPLQLHEFSQITVTCSKDTIQMFINGEPVGMALLTDSVQVNTDSLVIGNQFKGYMDELRMWNYGKTAREVSADYGRFVDSKSTGLIAYWNADEGTGGYVYDRSMVNIVPNENHGRLIGDTHFESVIPVEEQLGYFGVTDKNGNYTIDGIRYNGVGENFKLVPILGIHQFDPVSKILFIGEGATIHNDINFKDISSFKVEGYVKYKDCSCYTKDVNILIDGEPVMKNGQLVQTDKNGYFKIYVPIGEHRISVASNYSHVFSRQHFPSEDGYYDFQDSLVIPDPFIDSTLIKVVGRVAGGDREGDKKLGFGLSKNNIGKTSIILKSQLGNGCKTDTITTNDSTAEYSVLLPPLIYEIPAFKINSNPLITFEQNELLDLSYILPLQYFVDTNYTNADKTQWDRIDSVSYHKIRNFIYYDDEPELVVDLQSEEQLIFVPRTGDPDTIDLKQTPFIHPVFKTNSTYSASIRLIDMYTNYDNGTANPVYDTVPVDKGTLIISNFIKGKVDSITIESAVSNYNFNAGPPNIIDPYTKSIGMVAKTAGRVTYWDQEGYVLGHIKAEGSDFYTKGPDVVHYILRDPPGSNSYSYIKEGSTISYAGSLEFGQSFNNHFQSTIMAGAEFTAGMGVAIKNEIDYNREVKLIVGGEFTEKGEWYTNVTIDKRIQTNSSSDAVGALSDVFVGESMNFFISIADYIEIMPDSLCGVDGIKCNNDNQNGYTLGKRRNLAISRDSVATFFLYDVNHIENYLLPVIEQARNNMFIMHPDVYISHLNAGDPNYGTNNDDPVWGADVSTITPYVGESADTNGLSYLFRASLGDIDSVRMFNQEIRLWKEYLAYNEKVKAMVKEENKIDNISFNAGPGYSYSHSSAEGGGFTFSAELFIKNETIDKLKAEINGVGVETEFKMDFTFRGKTSHTIGKDNRTEYGFVLQDQDQGDYFSVDIYEPETPKNIINDTNRISVLQPGPVFILRGGHSSCPYEGKVMSKYYKVNGNFVQLSDGTLRRDVPQILIENKKYAELYNIPSDEKAVFNLSLQNASESHDPRIYATKVIEASNPYGAQIRIDGMSVTREFPLPADASINKQLTVAKGPDSIDYNNLGIIFYSPCQYFSGTSNNEDIADTIFFSVHFIPSCTDITISQPSNNWVVNSSFHDNMNILMNDYDVNYSGFEKMQFQYKQSAASDDNWVTLQTFYNDTSNMPPDGKPIPKDRAYSLYQWNLEQLTDGNYDIRAKTVCDFMDADIYSEIYTGVIDRINPHPFGNPQPADGILSPNDEIMIQFNENIDLGSLSKDNFDIRGVLNGAELTHDGSIYFDGDNDYMEISEGINLKESFTIEFWLRRNNTGNETILIQGINDAQSIQLGFNASDQFEMKFCNQILTSNISINDDAWRYYACSYNEKTNTAKIIIFETNNDDSNYRTLFVDYTEGGKVVVGKSLVGNQTFKGNIHQLRIWNKAFNMADIAERRDKILRGNEGGIIGCWPMDDMSGNQARDIIRNRHGIVYNATWAVDPSGRSYQFDGINGYLELDSIKSRYIVFTKETDFTIEFCFKGNTPADTVCLLSNGKGDLAYPNNWAVYTCEDGLMRIRNNGRLFVASDSNYFDNNWHHMALVVKRKGNTSVYIDGNLQKTVQSKYWDEFSGSKLWIGCRGWIQGATELRDRYFNGLIDEIRIWDLARVVKQIQRDKHYKLKGDEYGLRCYIPFEKYSGIILTETFEDVTETTDVMNSYGNATFSNDVPLIKLSRPVSAVSFDYSVNGDKMIFTPGEGSGRIENVTLDITVKDVKDLHGNIMQSKATWIAYVDKNQVLWLNDKLSFKKKVDDPLTFVSEIVNTGGEIKEFEINNIPNWLTIDPSCGAIEPNTSMEITFTVDEGMTIGNYEENIGINTDFGYDEILKLSLQVYATEPSWNPSPSDYEYSMNVIGQISIDGIISNDANDMIGAFSEGQCVGAAKLKYIESYDRYLVFIDIYSNDSVANDTILFKIWDASQGKVYSQVLPELNFIKNAVTGTPSTPITFSTFNQYENRIYLTKGWNWVSFNLETDKLADLNQLFETYLLSQGDYIKGKTNFAQYDQQTWNGNINELLNTQMYMIHVNNSDTFVYTGTKIRPETLPITIGKGWNWISYVPQSNMSVADAFGNFNPVHEDVVKNQYSFAMYDNFAGWIGTLKYMRQGEGYMYKASENGTLVYPTTGMLKSAFIEDTRDNNYYWKVDYNEFESNMNFVIRLIDPDNLIDFSTRQIGAFINDKCVGVTKFGNSEMIAENLAFLTVHYDGLNADIEFLVYDETNSKLYSVDKKVTYQADAVVGSVSNPYVLKISDKADENNVIRINDHVTAYPNPFNKSITIDIDYNIKGRAVLEIYNSLGEKIYRTRIQDIESKQYIIWNGCDNSGFEVAPGVYNILLWGDYVNESFKIVKTD